MRALFALLAWLCVAGAAVAQPAGVGYGPGPCSFSSAACNAVTPPYAGAGLNSTALTFTAPSPLVGNHYFGYQGRVSGLGDFAFGQLSLMANVQGAANVLQIGQRNPAGYSTNTYTGVDPYYTNVSTTCSPIINTNTMSCTGNAGQNGTVVEATGVPGGTIITNGGGTTSITMSSNATSTPGAVATIFAPMFEHMALGWLNNQGFNIIESSSFDANSNPLLAPSGFIFYQTGGIDQTGGTSATCATTQGSPTITCGSNVGANGTLVGPALGVDTLPSVSGIPAATTISSGGGTTTGTMSSNATVTNASIVLSFTTPTYGQRLVMSMTRTGPVYFYDWNAKSLIGLDRVNSRVQIGGGSPVAAPLTTLDVRGGGVFGTGTTFRTNAVNTGYALAVNQPSGSVKLLYLSTELAGGFGTQMNGTGATARIDYVDEGTGGVIPFTIGLNGGLSTNQHGPTFYSGVVKTTPATGGTVTFAATQRTALIVPAGTLATLTVTLPTCAAANNGDEKTVILSRAITALTVGSSSTVVSGPTAATAGQHFIFTCYGADASWY